jgi:hypothetical protein
MYCAWSAACCANSRKKIASGALTGATFASRSRLPNICRAERRRGKEVACK